MEYLEGLFYKDSYDESVYVAGLGKCTDTDIVIPPVYKGKNVTSIGYSAFYACTDLTSITIPNSVTSIRAEAFGHCHSLRSVTIPNSVTSIGGNAFYYCANLRSITIPESVTSIRSSAFKNCTNLTSVTIPEGVTRIGGNAFYGCISLTSVNHNYKAFFINKAGNLQCRNKRFRMGKKNQCRGPLELCKNGIHYCTNIFDIFNYYSGEYGKDFVIGICDVSDENIGGNDDSKRCARWVIPNKILTRKEVINIMNGGDISE